MPRIWRGGAAPFAPAASLLRRLLLWPKVTCVTGATGSPRTSGTALDGLEVLQPIGAELRCIEKNKIQQRRLKALSELLDGGRHEEDWPTRA